MEHERKLEQKAIEKQCTRGGFLGVRFHVYSLLQAVTIVKEPQAVSMAKLKNGIFRKSNMAIQMYSSYSFLQMK